MIFNRPNKLFFYLLLLTTSYFAYLLVKPYLPVVVFSAVTVVSFLPIYHRLFAAFRGRKGWAVTATIFFVLLILLVPLTLILNITINQALAFTQEFTAFVRPNNVSLTNIVNEINLLLAKIPYEHGYTLTSTKVLTTIESAIQPIGTYIANFAVNLGSSSVDLIAKFIIYLVVTASLFPSYEKILQLIRDLSPLDDSLDQKYIDRVTIMTKSMLRGVFVIAVAQGLSAGIFLLIADVKYATFWTILAIFFSILPMGANIITIPIGIVLLLLGQTWQGVTVIIGSLLIVSNIDNLLIPLLVPKEARLNSAIVLISVFGGIQLFGVLGLIYGPVVMILLITTIEIYLEHYREI